MVLHSQIPGLPCLRATSWKFLLPRPKLLLPCTSPVFSPSTTFTLLRHSSHSCGPTVVHGLSTSAAHSEAAQPYPDSIFLHILEKVRHPVGAPLESAAAEKETLELSAQIETLGSESEHLSEQVGQIETLVQETEHFSEQGGQMKTLGQETEHFSELGGQIEALGPETSHFAELGGHVEALGSQTEHFSEPSEQFEALEPKIEHLSELGGQVDKRGGESEHFFELIGQIETLASETENFSEIRQRLKVGRRVFLTGERAYQRWLPSSEKEGNVQGMEEELDCEEAARSIIPISDSWEPLQAADGDGENSGGTELQDLELGEAEETQLSVEPIEASERESIQDLLIEFLKKRSAKWGDGGDGLLRLEELDRDVGEPSPGALKNQTLERKVDNFASDLNSNSLEESVPKQLLGKSGEAVSTQEKLSHSPSTSEGGEMHHQATNALAEEIVGIAKSLPQNASLETFLNRFLGEISSSDGNLVLRALGEAQLAWPMLSFFQWMRVHVPSLLDSRSFCTLFASLGKLGMAQKAHLQYQNMPEDGVFHCTQVYNALLGALVRSGRPEKAAPILKVMEDRQIKKDAVTYSILIAAAKGRKESVDKVWAIFDDMLRDGVRPTVSVFGSLIKAFCDSGHLKEALLVSLSMEKMGVYPNVVIYNTLIDAHGKASQLEEAEGLLLEMRQRQLRPTESTYNALINGYGRSGQLDVAEEMLSEMERDGLNPDVYSYTSLISAYGKQKMSEKAADVFVRMRKMGVMPTTHTYTVLINAYAEGGWHDKAQRAFDSMVRLGLKPTVEAYTALLDAYRRAGDLDMVRHVWTILKEDGCELTQITYRTIMDAFGKHGLYVEARDVMEEFRKRGMGPNTMVYNILLNAYGRGGLHTKFPRVLAEMQALGCEPDSFTYCTLIYAFIRLRRFTGAFKHDREMVEKGLMPEPNVYKKMRAILDAKYALKVENDKKANAGHDPEGQRKSQKNSQRAKRGFKRYRQRGPLRGSERTKALWKDKEKQVRL